MSLQADFADVADLAWLVEHDPHISPDWVARCVAAREYILARADGDRIGYLRFSWFWRTLPYMEMIWVLPEHRRQGCGGRLLQVWEERMAEAGAHALMTSSVADELEPQAWHARNGYAPCGSLDLAPLQSSTERFFLRTLQHRLAPAGEPKRVGSPHLGSCCLRHAKFAPIPELPPPASALFDAPQANRTQHQRLVPIRPTPRRAPAGSRPGAARLRSRSP